jgi:hypothetical protein
MYIDTNRLQLLYLAFDNPMNLLNLRIYIRIQVTF